MKYKLLIFSIIIIGWCGVIFYASNKTSAESNSTSKKIIYNCVSLGFNITNKFHLTHFDLREKNISSIADKLNYPLRKCAHATVYFILAILLFTFFKMLGLDIKKVVLLTISLCFIYSLTDEYHQTFISNRTGRFSDCLIDTTGSIVSVTLQYIILKFKNKKFLAK